MQRIILSSVLVRPHAKSARDQNKRQYNLKSSEWWIINRFIAVFEFVQLKRDAQEQTRAAGGRRQGTYSQASPPTEHLFVICNLDLQRAKTDTVTFTLITSARTCKRPALGRRREPGGPVPPPSAASSSEPCVLSPGAPPGNLLLSPAPARPRREMSRRRRGPAASGGANFD
ncbi:hypothetical protein EVAR_92938_1 [Eumeta japonica]|uniref:Uncharacterized protein n=1 Tax=Eumeta variegata TaxID=151549 RepID=A0A4C1TBB8_EUMVA|nr:hypothetical protein EVAR_92938_1 [Eumeta japonica]